MVPLRNDLPRSFPHGVRVVQSHGWNFRQHRSKRIHFGYEKHCTGDIQNLSISDSKLNILMLSDHLWSIFFVAGVLWEQKLILRWREMAVAIEHGNLQILVYIWKDLEPSVRSRSGFRNQILERSMFVFVTHFKCHKTSTWCRLVIILSIWRFHLQFFIWHSCELTERSQNI